MLTTGGLPTLGLARLGLLGLSAGLDELARGGASDSVLVSVFELRAGGEKINSPMHRAERATGEVQGVDMVRMLPGPSDEGGALHVRREITKAAAQALAHTPVVGVITWREREHAMSMPELPTWSSLLCAGFLLLAPSVVVAAPPPTLGGGSSGPEQEACNGRAIGDACTLPNRQLGTCGQGTCNRLDYSQGSPPRAIEEPCVVCQANSGHEQHPTLGSGGAPPDESGASTGAGSGADDDKQPPESSSRCRVTDDLGDPALLGLASLLLLSFARRRV